MDTVLGGGNCICLTFEAWRELVCRLHFQLCPGPDHVCLHSVPLALWHPLDDNSRVFLFPSVRNALLWSSPQHLAVEPRCSSLAYACCVTLSPQPPLTATAIMFSEYNTPFRERDFVILGNCCLVLHALFLPLPPSPLQIIFRESRCCNVGQIGFIWQPGHGSQKLPRSVLLQTEQDGARELP